MNDLRLIHLADRNGLVPQWRSDGQAFDFCCPLHDDQTASGSAWIDHNSVAVCCHAGCDQAALARTLGVPFRRLRKTDSTKEYIYHNENGGALYGVEKRVRNGDKIFRSFRIGMTGNKIYDLKGVRRVLYRLKHVLSAPPAKRIFVVEGEKDAETLRARGLVATTCIGGARSWRRTDATPLADRHIVVIADNDQGGLRFGRDVVSTVIESARSVRLVERLPGVPEHGDVTDFLQMGHKLDELMELIRQTPALTAADVAEWNDEPDQEVILDRDDIKGMAEAALLRYYTIGDLPVFVTRADVPYAYENGHYQLVERDAVRAQMWEFLPTILVPASRHADEDELVPFKPRGSIVHEVMEAMRALSYMSIKRQVPCWRDGYTGPDPREIVPVKNALVHVPTGEVRALTPGLFITHQLDVEYIEDCPRPRRWIRFLIEIFAGERDTIREVQKLFGLLLTRDISYQKIFLLIGPPGSGKSTLTWVMRSLLGPHDVASPDLNDLAEKHGPSSLLNAGLALMSEVATRGVSQRAVQKLLAISGGDSIQVESKWKDPVQMIVPSRIVILSNEVPQLRDPGGALLRRYLILVTKRSFKDNPDRDLQAKLSAEMPGILRWALRGYRRLAAGEGFIQPRSGREELGLVAEAGSPIRAFAEECCEVGPAFRVSVKELFAAFCAWCEEANIRAAPTRAAFGKEIKAALPNVKRVNDNSKPGRPGDYRGIRLKDNGPY